MPNFIQRLLYNFSTSSPLYFLYVLFLWIKNAPLTIIFSYLILGVVLSIFFLISFWYCKQKLPNIGIKVKSSSPNNQNFLWYVYTYILPLAGALPTPIDLNMKFAELLGLLPLLICCFLRVNANNTILAIWGYKFFTVETVDNVSGYLMISKKDIRNSKQIRYVKRFSEYLLIHAEVK